MKKNWKTPKKKKHVTSSNLVPGELFPLNTSAIQTLIRVKSLSTFYSKKKNESKDKDYRNIIK